MTPKQNSRAAKWTVFLVLVLMLATTAPAVPAMEARRAAAQSPDILLPLVTEAGEQGELAPDMPIEAEPAAPIGDSRDTNSGDYDVPAEPAAVNAFNATQWTVQNNLGVGTDAPTADIDLSRNVNNYTRIWVRNPNAGGNAQSQLALTTANSYSLALQQFGSGFSASWNGKSLKNMARLRTSPSIQGLILTTGGPYPLIMGTADQERVRITPDGNVGIGTTTPQAKLHVQGASAVDGVEVTQPGGDGVYVTQPGDDGVHVVLPGDDGVYVNQPGTYGLRVNCPCGDATFPNTGVLVSSGNIRVQNGSFIDTGTTLNVPDYVFEPEYPLMSLDELRTYVTEEKHLPNVPNEEEIRAGGLDLSDFQMKLLEKTEELTLYTLAQDDRINSQQQEIRSLQQDNQAKDEQLENQGEQIEALQQMIADLETRLAALEEQE